MWSITQFELFCAAFYALDVVSEKQAVNKSENQALMTILSKMKTSAHPAMFPEFCSFVQQEEIPIEDSYNVVA